MVTILQMGEQILRDVAKPLPLEEVSSSHIAKILDDMWEALTSQDDGIAIAAPQIGHSIRIFMVSGKVLETVDKEKYAGLPERLVFINPVITKLSKETQVMEEGCLSVRWLYGKVKRAKKATIRAYNERGELFERGASGILAQAFQHEVDHLNGILFIDKATDIEEAVPSEDSSDAASSNASTPSTSPAKPTRRPSTKKI